jgi:putative selenium metabolism protein SsnA
MPRPLLIENGTVVSTGGRQFVASKCSVLIEDGLITRVAPKARFARFKGKRIDASGKVVMPGLINAHTHFYSTFSRGLTGTKPAGDFLGVLRNLWWRLDRALTLEDCYYGALVALLDCIRHGTTTVIDHHASPRAVSGSLASIARAVRETGLRACLCYEVSDRDGARVAEEGLAENAEFIEECRQQNDSCMKALFGLHASFTLSDRTLEWAAMLGQESDAGFHIHLAEAQSDQDITVRRSGKRVVERLKRFGLLGRRSIAAHGVHLSRREIDLLAETQTAVVHNPQSNLNNAVGIANIVELKRRGVRLGLGTDAMTTNLLEELRVGLWAQHLGNDNPSAGFGELTNALFSGNADIAARCFGLPFGELREGAAGDIALFEYDPPTPLDDTNLFGHVVFGISQAAADTTIVGGRVLMENKQLALNLDEERLNRRARELARNLWKRMQSER